MLREGAIVDATLIAAAPSNKNRKKARDPEMHQTKKGDQWYFGMKNHVGADAHTGLVHSLKGTAANTADVSEAHALLHGDEAEVFADAGYQGADKRAENAGSSARWHIPMKRGERKKLTDSQDDQHAERWERLRAKIRAKVEPPPRGEEPLGHRKVPYRGLAKNEAQLFTLFALGNLLIGQRYLRRHGAQGAS